MLEWNFTCYNEDCVIVGMKSSGKTYLANEILRGLKGVNVIVYDFNHQFHSARAIMLHEVNEVFTVFDSTTQNKQIIFQPFDKSENIFRKFCSEIFNRSNIVVMIDETHFFVSKQKILKEYNDLILSGRPRGISVISISSRPQNLPSNTLTNARHIFAFKLNLLSDVQFLESWLGRQAWQLLPPDQRKKTHRLAELPQLEEHSFFYRDTLQTTGVISRN